MPDAHPQTAIPKDTTKAPVQPGRSKNKQHEKGVDGHSETPQPMANVNTPQESPTVPVKPIEITPEKHETQPTGAPPNIIPQDPVKALEVVDRMRRSLAEVIRKKDTVTFLMSWPDDDNSNLVLVNGLISDACRDTPRQCWFAQKSGDARDLDKPPVPDSSRNGLTIHGADARSLAAALGAWFSTYSTETYPQQLKGYKYKETKELIWIEIGPGSPWKNANH